MSIIFIRNFSIIAHINHGKSTLADRFIELCKNLKLNKNEQQYLDTMDIERERGITIKAQTLTLEYFYDNNKYILNLIDTPGHSDFSCEVSRSLSVCEGVILLIDITKGIQAQTIANYNKALENNLSIIIALNKIDLLVSKENIYNDIKKIFNTDDIIKVSAKTGEGVVNLLSCIINKIPPPQIDISLSFNALIFDSYFDKYFGITCLVKIKSGTIKKNDKIILSFNKKCYKVNDVGIFIPEKFSKNILSAGHIGFVTFLSKNLEDIKVGSYMHSENFVLNDFKIETDILSKIYVNVYPVNIDDFISLKNAIQKLCLNDSSLKVTIQKSPIFGFGFKCGFLGVLHMDIIRERLEREYGLYVIFTPPNIEYKIILNNLNIVYISNPSDLDSIKNIKEIQEQIALVDIISPSIYLGKIIQLCVEFRGIEDNVVYLNDKVYIKYKIPFNELVFKFFSKLQVIASGFASMDYKLIGYEKADLLKISILINEKKIDALEFIVHKKKIFKFSIDLLDKIKTVIHRQLFDIKIQAAVGKKIISKVVIKALRKNVLAKCYGGDITRKKKLLEKQKTGKKKLKKIGNVEIPHDTFIKIMDLNK